MDYVVDLIWDLTKNAIGAGIGVVCAYLVFRFDKKRRYGNWSAVLKDGDREVDRQPIGVETTKSWLADTWARKLGLKSLCADNKCFLNTNVLNISHIDAQQREFVVRFDENPQPDPKPPHEGATRDVALPSS